MNFIELYVIFFVTSLLLLIIEVILGMTLGVALAGSITFFTLAVLELIGVLNGLNSYLIVGSILFIVFTTLVLMYFRKSYANNSNDADVNEY
jgi:ABC-type lipoprotein release transport system permease subunit